jgi:hypothetical protein
VVLGQPEPVKAQLFRMSGVSHAVRNGLADRIPLPDRSQFEQGKGISTRDGEPSMSEAVSDTCLSLAPRSACCIRCGCSSL